MDNNGHTAKELFSLALNKESYKYFKDENDVREVLKAHGFRKFTNKLWYLYLSCLAAEDTRRMYLKHQINTGYDPYTPNADNIMEDPFCPVCQGARRFATRKERGSLHGRVYGQEHIWACDNGDTPLSHMRIYGGYLLAKKFCPEITLNKFISVQQVAIGDIVIKPRWNDPCYQDS